MSTISLPRRASLDYQYVFDLCTASALEEGVFPLYINAPHPLYLYELLCRLTDLPTALHLVDTLCAGQWYTLSRAGHAPQQIDVLAEAALSSARSLIWAEPTAEACRHWLPALAERLPGEARLHLIVSHRLARLLPEGKQGWLGSAPMMRLSVLKRLLRENHFLIDEVRSFHGPVSLLWWQASIAFERAGQQALADRCWFAMRASFNALRWQQSFATVSLLLARPARAHTVTSSVN